MPGPFVAIMTAFSVIQGLAGFMQQRSAGRTQKRVSEFNATLAGARADALEQEAGQARAAAQREAAEDRRQGRIRRSRAAAVMGASGTAVDTDILGDIDTEAETRALTSLYKGEESARGAEYNALLTRAGAQGIRQAGAAEKDAAYQRGTITLAGGIGQGAILYQKYGQGGPDASDSVVNSIRTGYG